ncbi:unnamed protein product [Adineta ricciae]|uniref:Uncharacterized protein n=1 Tax=Adineta ricciae TaxID=249248 RepID=A0A813QZD0_ADIRI|nr:unnamed protein product [Adineta ricciae]CAF0775649.1 unnamed protein product [Adineta ricciae]
MDPDRRCQSDMTVYEFLPTRTNMLEHYCVAFERDLEDLIAGQDPYSIIDLSYQNLTDASMPCIIKNAIYRKECKILNLWGNRFTSKSLFVLIKALEGNQTLHELDLSHNSLGDDGIQILSQFFSLNNCEIKHLDLSSNNVTEVGAHSIADMLRRNRTIKRLSLNKNDITDIGLVRIAEEIQNGNERIVELKFDDNPNITREGIEAVLGILRNHRSLEGIYVQNCGVFSQRIKEDLEENAFRTGFDVFV